MNEVKLKKTNLFSRAASVRSSLAVAIMVAVLSLGTAVTASAGDGGGITSGSDGTSDSDTRNGDRYTREWESFTRKDRRWARRTSECESGQNARIHDGSGSFHGAFQFMKSTWRTSPMSPGGDPHSYRWKVQAVVAVKLKHRDSDEHWPYCGDI